MPLAGTTVRAIDTNVVARFLLEDDLAQAAVASGLLREGAYVSITVLMELSWLLASRYALSQPVIAESITALLDLPTVQVERADAVRWAIDRYAAGADLADMLHLVAASPAERFATFDRAVATQAGADAPIAIETLR